VQWWAMGKKRKCGMREWQRVKSGKLSGRSPAFYQVTTWLTKRFAGVWLLDIYTL